MGLHMTVFQLTNYNFERMIGDLGDSRFILSIVEYNYQWICGNYTNYWEGFFMYPDNEVISYSDNLLGITPFYSVLRLLGLESHSAFQALIVLCHVLNFLFCYYCFFQVSGNRYGAAAGAFIFAFSIALNGMHNHPQYTFRFCIPLFYYALIHYLNSYRFKYLFLSTIFLVYQFYLGIYLGYFLLLTGSLFAVLYFILRSKDVHKLKKLFIHTLIGAVLFCFCILPLFYFYFKRNQVTGYYTDYDFYMQTIPRLSSYLKSFDASLSWYFLSDIPVYSKYEWVHALFPGLLVFLSIFYSIYLAKKKQGMYSVILLALFIFISFTLYYNGHTLYGYLMKIPGIKAARVVSRVISVLLFFGGMLLCYNIKDFSESFPHLKKSLIILLPLLLLFDNYCLPSGFKTYDKAEACERILNLEEKIKQRQDYVKYKAFAYVPGIKKESHIHHLDAMLVALNLKMKTVNGYSSSAHKFYGPFWRNIDSASLSHWCLAMSLPIDSVLRVK
jgi:hypothetical protein